MAQPIATLSISNIAPIVFSRDPKDRRDFLQQHHLIASTMLCGSCNSTMRIGEKSDISDGYIIRCPSCKTTKSLRHGSFFSKSRLSLKQWLVLIYWWVREYSVTQAAQEAEVGHDSAINVYQWLREVCSTKLIQTQVLLGGPGKVVQIDESLFKHKPQVNYTIYTMLCTLLSSPVSSRTCSKFRGMGVWNGRRQS